MRRVAGLLFVGLVCVSAGKAQVRPVAGVNPATEFRRLRAMPEAEREKTQAAFQKSAEEAYARQVTSVKDPCAAIEQQQLMNSCLAGQTGEADADVKIYFRAVALYSDSAATVAKLAAAQKRWEQYREDASQLASDQYRGGSLAPAVYAQMYVLITRDRMRELHSVYEPFPH